MRFAFGGIVHLQFRQTRQEAGGYISVAKRSAILDVHCSCEVGLQRPAQKLRQIAGP